jgi:hypothetical protein
VRDGFYAAERDKELPCAGLELRVVWSMEDVSARVHEAVKPDMTLAQACKAREVALRAIEDESRLKTGLVSEAVDVNHGGRYQLYRYKKYTDVRLVFAPEESIASLVDACFFRAYENGKPAKVTNHLRWSRAAPATGDLVLISGYPGESDRFRTSADLEARYGMRYFLRFKIISRLNNRLAEFARANPEHKRRAEYEASLLDGEVGSVLSALDSLEKILGRIRAREQAEQSLLVQEDPEAATQRQEALDRIAVCVRENHELSQAYFFLETAHAFQSDLFDYARGLLRLADESAKLDVERLPEYSGADRQETKRILLECKPIVKEMEIAKLAESLDLWARYAGPDAELAGKVLDGKTPQERARVLIEGTQLDQLEVRKALMQGGKKAVAESQDTMLALARLVDARSRYVRQQAQEKIAEPCRQAYAVLMRARERLRGGESYPDAHGTLRLSFSKVQPHGDSKIMQASRAGIVSLADIFRWLNESRQESMLPKTWQAARSALDEEAPILFGCSADVVPGSSGSPIVDRQGRLVGIASRGGGAIPELDYLDDTSGCGAVAARGILEVLDKVYHAAELVKELGGNRDPSRTNSDKQKEAPDPLLLPPPPLPPPSVNTGSPPPSRSPSGSQVGALPFTTSPPGSFDPSVPPALAPLSLVNPFSPPEALLYPASQPPSTLVAQKATSPGNRHKELAPALIKALNDSDDEVRQAAATGLENLGGDALPALIEALQAKDKSLRSGAALVLGKLGTEGQKAIPALIGALEDEDVEVRRQAARALAAVVRASRQP